MILNIIFKTLYSIHLAGGDPERRRSEMPRLGARAGPAPQEPHVIVCQCKAISEAAVRQAIREGAHSWRQVARACQAGRGCGGCKPLIRELIARESDDERETPLLSVPELAATG
jgi:NAD(P)H-nitrite reductase large subunit